MQKKLLSVVVPVYNAGGFLEPLVESILRQRWENLELLLVDDGSTDGSDLICDKISEIDKRVRVIHMKNGGQSEARNVGMANAKGDYIAFADHDDLLHPYMYEVLISEMERTNLSVCACAFKNVQQKDFSNIVFNIPKGFETIIYEEKDLIHNYLTPTWRIPIWTKVYRREVLKNIKFSNCHLGEDNLFSYKIIKECKKMAFVDWTFYFQRMHGNNFEFVGNKYYVELLEVKEKILRDIEKNYSFEYLNAKKLFLYECIRIFNSYVNDDSEYLYKYRYQVLKILKRNIKQIDILDIPVGHKILCFKIKIGLLNRDKKIII